jgi:hypothetical protein
VKRCQGIGGTGLTVNGHEDASPRRQPLENLSIVLLETRAADAARETTRRKIAVGSLQCIDERSARCNRAQPFYREHLRIRAEMRADQQADLGRIPREHC